ncbi:MAG: DUF695 domain-containing protein [Bacteroidetes bacterium]|nr:DUF695 domain-containing protein [Bacteroidota bacterium]
MQITLEYQNKNESGLPDDTEAIVLNDMEEELEAFIKQHHQTHYIGRVTRRDYRDIIFYVDKPNFEENSTADFLDRMNDIRHLNFRIDRDENWHFVSGLLK